MPQAPDHLRAKFMIDGDDGIDCCETIVLQAGGDVFRGLIFYNGSDREAWDAVNYLILEWDYDLAKTREEWLEVVKAATS